MLTFILVLSCPAVGHTAETVVKTVFIYFIVFYYTCKVTISLVNEVGT
jgi:hypothetical protein